MTTPRGRTPKLTPEIQKVICEGIAAGIDRKHAAARAGISERTMVYWMRRGRDKKNKLYVAFVASVKKAEADAVARNVAIIQKAASTAWTAAAWWLERRHPDEYGSDRKRIRELEKMLANLMRGENGSAGNNPQAGSQAAAGQSDKKGTD